MKKKYRDITVNDVKYAWTPTGDGAKIWLNKKVIFDECISDAYCEKVHQGLGHYLSVTPKVIRQIILDNDF